MRLRNVVTLRCSMTVRLVGTGDHMLFDPGVVSSKDCTACDEDKVILLRSMTIACLQLFWMMHIQLIDCNDISSYHLLISIFWSTPIPLLVRTAKASCLPSHFCHSLFYFFTFLNNRLVAVLKKLKYEFGISYTIVFNFKFSWISI